MDRLTKTLKPGSWLLMQLLVLACCLLLVSAGAKQLQAEDAAQIKVAQGEHPGTEHPGSDDVKEDEEDEEKKKKKKKKKREHPGEKKKEHPGSTATNFTAKDIKTAMMNHIKAKTKNTNGVFRIKDEKANKTLFLEFVKIHDPVRKIAGKGYFACTDFHPVGEDATKLYDLDFWLNPKDGRLQVTKTAIHKHPHRQASKWVKKARYTFIDDKPVEIN